MGGRVAGWNDGKICEEWSEMSRLQLGGEGGGDGTLEGQVTSSKAYGRTHVCTYLPTFAGKAARRKAESRNNTFTFCLQLLLLEPK